jgi:hypothetical protein
MGVETRICELREINASIFLFYSLSLEDPPAVVYDYAHARPKILLNTPSHPGEGILAGEVFDHD